MNNPRPPIPDLDPDRQGYFTLFCEMLRPMAGLFPIFATLLFFGALLWAKWQSPFSRCWFSLENAGLCSFKCVAVLPKPIRMCPVIIYVHDTGGSLMNDGYELRQMCELGLVVVDLDFDQTNEVGFSGQFESLIKYITHQKWADTNAIAWVGFGEGANWMLDFARQHSDQLPRLLVQISGAGLPESSFSRNHGASLVRTSLPLLTSLKGEGTAIEHPNGFRLSARMHDARSFAGNLKLLLIHGDQDEIFPVTDIKQFDGVLKSQGVPVELKVIPGLSHSMVPERGVVFRSIGEYCLIHLGGQNAPSRIASAPGTSVWQKYHSIAQWQEETPRFWLFCVPAVAWAIVWYLWKRRNILPVENVKFNRYEIALRWVAVILAIWAMTETAFHLVPPYFPVNERTLSIARRILVQPKEQADFETLACQPIWKEQKLGTLLTHVSLANYNRELINWQLNATKYENYVLSPVITGIPGERFDWRRPLWEEFYPRIRHESSSEDAARIVVRHLRARVTIAAIPDPPRDVPTIWLRQLTDQTGFEIIYVAALRSVGVPARLDSNHQAEFWDGSKWSSAPSPAVISW